MTVEPCGDHIILTPHTDDELDLLAGMVQAIGFGGDIQVRSSLGGTRLVFDGDESQAKKRKRKVKRKATTK